jgi:hypothetical protein
VLLNGEQQSQGGLETLSYGKNNQASVQPNNLQTEWS